MKKIIPCLDINNGRVIKGVNFVNFVDAGDPSEIAEFYCKQNADEIVFLDISASVENRATLVDVIKKAAQKVTIPLTVGGGIRSISDAEKILDAGADKISINSAAVNRPKLIDELANKFGREKVVVAIDVAKGDNNRYEVFINGGNTNTNLDAVEWAIEAAKRGAGEILLTSKDRDGVKTGYDLDITKQVADAVDISVIASGGAGKLEDFYDAFEKAGAQGALAASLFHFKELSIGEVKAYLNDKGINVKL